MSLKLDYRNLETQTYSALRDYIDVSQNVSEFYNTKCLKIDIENYIEICIIDDRLVLVDLDGGHTNITAFRDLELLIELL